MQNKDHSINVYRTTILGGTYRPSGYNCNYTPAYTWLLRGKI